MPRLKRQRLRNKDVKISRWNLSISFSSICTIAFLFHSFVEVGGQIFFLASCCFIEAQLRYHYAIGGLSNPSPHDPHEQGRRDSRHLFHSNRHHIRSFTAHCIHILPPPPPDLTLHRKTPHITTSLSTSQGADKPSKSGGNVTYSLSSSLHIVLVGR